MLSGFNICPSSKSTVLIEQSKQGHDETVSSNPP
jgi:hypothetical protein